MTRLPRKQRKLHTSKICTYTVSDYHRCSLKMAEDPTHHNSNIPSDSEKDERSVCHPWTVRWDRHGQWYIFYWDRVSTVYGTKWHPTHKDHTIPSIIEWPGRTGRPVIQGCDEEIVSNTSKCGDKNRPISFLISHNSTCNNWGCSSWVTDAPTTKVTSWFVTS